MAQAERYAFIVEYFDPHSTMTWRYQFFYYLTTSEIEMYDIKNKRTFLKRCPSEAIQPDMLYIGSTINVYSRQLKICDFADTYTRNRLQQREQRTCAIIKPDAFLNSGKIMNAIVRSDLRINKLRLCRLSKEEAMEFYSIHQDKPFYEALCDYMSSGAILAMEVVGAGAVSKWRQLLGPTNSLKAKQEAPDSIRAHFGTDNTQNAAHGSDSEENASIELSFFFNTNVGHSASLENCTLCIIKPSAIIAGYAGLAIDHIAKNYRITAMELFRLDSANASEFLEVYRGVVPEFTAMVEELTSGAFIAMEVSGLGGENPVESFREFCGPADPEIARVLRPHSLRAQFGFNKVQNAIHCTDLPEDGELESNYFFNIMAS